MLKHASLFFSFFALRLFALDLTTLTPQGYVSDFARVVDPQTRLQIENYARRVEQATGAQIALVTLPTLDAEPVEDVANALFRRWGIGQKGKDEGLLLLLVIRDRRSRLEVGRGLEGVITDGTAGTVLREMRPSLREQRYGEALLTAAHELGARIAQSKNVTIPEEPAVQQRRRERPTEAPLPWPVLLGGGLLLLWIMSMGRRGYGGGGFLPGIILGNMMSRHSGGGSTHGGFGGYDSGDSFGGFGGGDSGGGGASSDW